MNRTEVKASSIKAGDKIFYNMGLAGLKFAGIVDRTYQMVENRIQVRMLPGGEFTALTFGRDDLVNVGA